VTRSGVRELYRFDDFELDVSAYDPNWDPYRSDPRFAPLLARCGCTRVR
jgi:hypothetical protein